MDATEEATSRRQSTPVISDIAKDVFLWRRKNLSLTVLLVSTAIWALLEFYKFNFVTVASWIAMLIIILIFLCRNILGLLGKEPPNMSGLEISEKTPFVVVNSVRVFVEAVIRWIFHVSVERERLVFTQVVAGLLSLSYVGTFSDLLTLLYAGIVIGMSVPVFYEKYGDQ